ncbi:LOW QUALITY PROTEIN: hypothetical protein Cgig2_008010 [Carnegiea gigantea]|uniref:Uncharacterized protein n=1 Tax=Carnegiea gigantea TaxID=171969 RepID=A0A9Q1L2D2_9CARY|nr:LOW QUALITY PROTEIN: hypothetical protein Cgig2_008010 [Carnegiea gigantea]
MDYCELTEMRSFGNYYSWTNIGRNGKRLWSRIDRAFTNLEWIQIFDFTQVDYLVEGISDHTPLKIAFHNRPRSKQSFKYCDMWSKDNQFQPTVDKVVKGETRGDKMHQLMHVLRKLQKPFQYLNGSRFRDIHVSYQQRKIGRNAKQDAPGPQQ